MTPKDPSQYHEQARDANNSAWVLAVDKFITEILRLQILLAWEVNPEPCPELVEGLIRRAGELTEGQAYRRLKQYGGCEGIMEARGLKLEAIEAGKGLAWPKPVLSNGSPELCRRVEGPLDIRE